MFLAFKQIRVSERVKMRKTFVLDTNVLLHNHNSLFSFKDNDIVIPLGVIEKIPPETIRNGELLKA